MNWKRASVAAALAAVIASVSVAYSGGLWQTWVGIGAASYCASTVTGTGSLGGITGQGQGSTGSICAQTVPAGPTVFNGTEIAPVDLYTPGTNVTSGGPQSAYVALPQLGQGAVQILSNWTSGATVSMNNNTVFMFVQPLTPQGASSAVTIALPTTPVEGQIARIDCVTSTYVGSVTVIAATGYALLPNYTTPQSCGATASLTTGGWNSFNFRLVAATTPTTSGVNTSPTWYRF